MVLILPIGVSLGVQVLQTKYGFEIPNEDFNKNIIRLTNQLWKLIPMREHNEDWQKQLDTVSIEIAGMNSLIETEHTSQFLQLLFKLEGLKEKQDIDFEIYRKTVFETINILQGMKK